MGVGHFMLRLRDNLWEWVLFFYHIGPEDQNQVLRFGGKCLNPLSHLSNLCLSTFKRQKLIKN